MRLHVLSVAYPFAIVGAGCVGGAEQVLTSLEAELVAGGHRSTVVARDGSTVAGRLLTTAVPDGVITDEMRDEVTRSHQGNIDLALATGGVDVVHMHGIDFDRYTVPHDVPVVVTLHLPPSWYPERIWSLPPNYRLQCVSETQRRACPARIQEMLLVIGNGVALPPADKLPKRRGYALMMSRICPEKNLHAGLDAARLAGVPVLLAGETFPYEEHLRYFREEIEPRLGDRARLLAPVAGAEKVRLLARARCLLLPTLAPETSSLAAMEAMAVGTPTVCYGSGAITEIVENGVTGFVVSGVEGMAAAIGQVGEIRPEVCREVAAARFPLRRMVEGYVGLYRSLIAERDADGGRDAGPMRTDEAVEVAPLRSAVESGDGAGEGVELRAAVLRTVEEMEALAPEWMDVWRDAGATPFQSPEWLLPWWRHVGEGELLAVTVRGGGDRLLGLLPAYVYTQPADGERHLLLLGAGTSDYLDGIFGMSGTAPGMDRETIVAAAVGELLRYGHQWDCWDRGFLHQLQEGSALLGYARRSGMEVFGSEPSSSVRVSGWAQMPAKIRANSGRYRRRAEARGTLCYKVAETVEAALQGLETLIGLHTRRWEGGGVLTSERVREHHRASVPRLMKAGLLWMLSLEMDGRVLAVLYAMVHTPGGDAGSMRERRMFCYLIGSDPDFGELSPGTLLLAYAYDRCEAEGVAWMDLLRGGEAYKHLWGAVEEATFGVVLPGGPRPGQAGSSRAVGAGSGREECGF